MLTPTLNLLGIAFVWFVLGPHAPAVSQELLQQLTGQGVRLNAENSIPLPAPALQPNQSALERQKVLQALSGKQGWEKFTRDSIHAPVTISISYIHNAQGTRMGHNIHTAFVAYADLETLRDEELMREVFGPTPESNSAEDDSIEDDSVEDATTALKATQVPQAELVKLGIDQASANEQYRTIELPLLNQVEVRGTVRIEKQEGPGWVVLVWHIDPRFAESEAYSAKWTKVERSALGEPIRTEPQPYAGCGGYMAVTQIDPQNKQLLIESRMILHEPVDWFSGSNFLRAKLPPALQENARNFRRRLEKLK